MGTRGDQVLTKEELIQYLGRRILDDADKLRLFMPDCYARFPLEWNGQQYEIQIIRKSGEKE